MRLRGRGAWPTPHPNPPPQGGRGQERGLTPTAVRTMTDEDLIGYALGLLDPAERAAVEAGVAADPDAAARLDRVKRAFAPLEPDRGDDDPPPGLALRTI